MIKLLVVGLGGFLGAIARYGLSSLVHRHVVGFPAGTLVVNVVGCFTLGVLMALVEAREDISPHVHLLATVGFLGGLTTFSAFGHETLELLQNDQTRLALLNLVANVALGVGAVLLGRLLVRFLG